MPEKIAMVWVYEQGHPTTKLVQTSQLSLQNNQFKFMTSNSDTCPSFEC